MPHPIYPAVLLLLLLIFFILIRVKSDLQAFFDFCLFFFGKWVPVGFRICRSFDPGFFDSDD